VGATEVIVEIINIIETDFENKKLN